MWLLRAKNMPFAGWFTHMNMNKAAEVGLHYILILTFVANNSAVLRPSAIFGRHSVQEILNVFKSNNIGFSLWW